jgi:YD repeat-containing protein
LSTHLGRFTQPGDGYAGTSGSLAMDEFVSQRYSMPELLSDYVAPDPEPTAQPSWLDASYSYNGSQAHAVTSVVRDQAGGGSVTDNYEYDNNGNMTCRYEGGTLYKHYYNAENRLEEIEEYDGSDCSSPGTLQQSWEFNYDGDGNRVKEVYIIGGQTQYTRYFFGGGMYEFEDDGVDVTHHKYYSVGGTNVAKREWENQGR